MATIENKNGVYESSADKIQEGLNLDSILHEVTEELQSLGYESETSFYEQNNKNETVTYKLDIVKNYLTKILDDVKDMGVKEAWNYIRNKKNSGAVILAVQISLEVLGYDVGKVGGTLTKMTKEAVNKFQEANGITVDGLPGKETIAKILELLNGMTDNTSTDVDPDSEPNNSEEEVNNPEEKVEEPVEEEVEESVEEDVIDGLVDGDDTDTSKDKETIDDSVDSDDTNTDVDPSGPGGQEQNDDETSHTKKKKKKEEENTDTSVVIITPPVVPGNSDEPKTPEKPDEPKTPEKSGDGDENSPEVLKDDTYGHFDCKDILTLDDSPKFNGEKIEEGKELVLTSVEELKFFTNDAKILARYDAAYFQKKHLAIKYFNICSPNYYNVLGTLTTKTLGAPKTAIYQEYRPELEHGMGLMTGECLYVECEKNQTVEWKNISESSEVLYDNAEIIDKIDNKVKDLREKLDALGEWNDDGGFDFAEGVNDSTENTINFDGVVYKEWSEDITGKAYKIEEGKLIMGNYKDGKLEGVAIEYDKDKNFYYGRFENGERNGIGIESLVDGTIYAYLYQKGKISVKEDINTMDKEIIAWADIMNADMDGLSDLIEFGQEREHDLESIKKDLYETKGKLEEIIEFGGDNGWGFKEGAEKQNGELTQIEYDGQTYIETTLPLPEDIADGSYYFIDDDNYSCIGEIKNGKMNGEYVLIDVIGGIHKLKYEEGVQKGESALLRFNGDILVDEYEDGVRLSREKLLDGDVEKMKSIKDQLSEIITINESKEFVFPKKGEEITLNGTVYKEISLDEIDGYTGDGYITCYDDELGQYYYPFGHFENGKLNGEAIVIYDSGNIYLGNFAEGVEQGGLKYDIEGKVYDYTFDTEGELIETERVLEGIEDVPYFERVKKFEEPKERLAELKDTLDEFISFDDAGKVTISGEGEIKFGDPEQTYVDGDASDFTGGYCYKIEDNTDGTQRVSLGIYDTEKNERDGEVKCIDSESIWINTYENGVKKEEIGMYNNGNMWLTDFDNEGNRYKCEELYADGSIEIGKYSWRDGHERTDYIKKIEKPNEDLIKEHINDVHAYLSQVVEYDTDKLELKLSDGVVDAATGDLTLGGKKYSKLTPEIEGRAYTFDEFEGSKAFIAGDFREGKLEGNAMIYLEGGVVLSGQFKDGKPDGVLIKRLPNEIVYLYKYDEGVQVCQKKLGDNKFDKVNQEYMNGKIGEFLDTPAEAEESEKPSIVEIPEKNNKDSFVITGPDGQNIVVEIPEKGKDIVIPWPEKEIVIPRPADGDPLKIELPDNRVIILPITGGEITGRDIIILPILVGGITIPVKGHEPIRVVRPNNGGNIIIPWPEKEIVIPRPAVGEPLKIELPDNRVIIIPYPEKPGDDKEDKEELDKLLVQKYTEISQEMTKDIDDLRKGAIDLKNGKKNAAEYGQEIFNRLSKYAYSKSEKTEAGELVWTFDYQKNPNRGPRTDDEMTPAQIFEKVAGEEGKTDFENKLKLLRDFIKINSQLTSSGGVEVNEIAYDQTITTKYESQSDDLAGITIQRVG